MARFPALYGMYKNLALVCSALGASYNRIHLVVLLRGKTILGPITQLCESSSGMYLGGSDKNQLLLREVGMTLMLPVSLLSTRGKVK